MVATSDFEVVEAGFEALDVELAGEVAIVAGIQRVAVKDGGSFHVAIVSSRPSLLRSLEDAFDD